MSEFVCNNILILNDSVFEDTIVITLPPNQKLLPINDTLEVFMIGMINFSLCLSIISGIVTDINKNPIAGAVVTLEKRGIETITEENGLFTLIEIAFKSLGLSIIGML